LCFGKKNKSGKMAWNKGQALIWIYLCRLWGKKDNKNE
jgi:hypothetical protein